MGNYSAVIVVFIIFAIISGIVVLGSFSGSRKNNRYLETQLDRLREMAERLKQIQLRMGAALQKDPQFTGCSLQELTVLLKEYRSTRTEVDKQLQNVRQANAAARKSLNGHVMAQNMFGGGANNLGALLVYGNQSRYVNISNKVPTITDDTMLIMRVMQYINYFTIMARMQGGAAAVPSFALNAATTQRAAVYQSAATANQTVKTAAPISAPAKQEARPEKQVSFLKEALLGTVLAAIILAVYFNWNSISQGVSSLVNTSSVSTGYDTTAPQDPFAHMHQDQVFHDIQDPAVQN